VIRLLMDRDFRAEALARLPSRARKNALLQDLNREYSLYEIAIITRAGTARALGLKNKGHLGVGADADVAIYVPSDNREEMFARPRYVLKDGEIVVRDGQLVTERPGRTLYVDPPYDPSIKTDLRAYFEECYTMSFDNYPVSSEYLHNGERIPCG
jgi:formylmethanofuran dehydrogenase subunit A